MNTLAMYFLPNFLVPNMRNMTGSPVVGSDLFGREIEIGRLWRDLENDQHVLMLAPRRVGKTSLMLELRKVPRPGWIVFYSDLEAGTDAGDCLADMAAQLASHPSTRTLAESLPFMRTIRDFVGRLEGAIDVNGARIEVKKAIAGDWTHAAAHLRDRLAALPAGLRALFIHDELPILVSRLLQRADGRPQVEQLLSWLRALRQDAALRGKASFLIGGSIGLQGVLRRHGLSAPINDLTIFRLEPWPREVARGFLRELALSQGFALADDKIDGMLDLLGEAVPYHVQLFFQSVRDLSQGDTGAVTERLVRRAFDERLAGPGGGPHLDHLAERLDSVLAPDDLATARAILGRASRSRRGLAQVELADLGPGAATGAHVLRLLEDDGYVAVANGRIRFRSNLVREYWKRRHAAFEAK